MSNEALQQSWRRQFAMDLVRSLNESGTDNYYLYIGKIDPWDNEQVPDTGVDSDHAKTDSWRNAVCLKRLDNRNIMLVVPRFDWTATTRYAQYDPAADLHTVGNLSKYYVLTDTYKVYKCISNNGGAESTSQPTHTTAQIVKMSDGYHWKFMYELTEQMREFLTLEYMPIKFIYEKLADETINQLNVQEEAVDGTVDLAEISSLGSKLYQASETMSKIVGSQESPTSLTLKLNDEASSITGQYIGYSIYLDDGRGAEIGQVRTITAYDGATKLATINKSFGHQIYLPDSSGNKGTSYKILPELRVHGDGTGLVLVPTINDNFQISGLTIVDKGRDYRDARVEVLTSSSSGTTLSTFKLYFSPPGGHGWNAPRELEAMRAMVVMQADQGDKDSDWPAENDFRQFGIIKNPVLNNEGITADNTVAGNEYTRLTELTILKPYGVTANYNYDSVAGTYKVGNHIIGNQTHSTAKILSFKTEPETEYSILDVENIKGSFLKADTLKNEYRYVLGEVTPGRSFLPGETITQYVGTTVGSGATAQGFVKSYKTLPFKELVLVGVTGTFSGSTGSLVGVSSGASGGDIKSFQVAGGELIKQYTSDGTGDFSFVTVDSDNKQNYGRIIQQKSTKIDLTSPPTYRLTTKLSVVGSGFSDTYFTEDTGVTQENYETNIETSSRVAWFKAHSGTTGDLFVTDVLGGFTLGSTLETHRSSGIQVTKIEPPEVVLGSGEVLYIQNVRPVERIREQEEEFKILLGF